MKYALQLAAITGLTALPMQANAQIKIAPWQIHEGSEGLIKFDTPTDVEKQAALDKAAPPSKTDGGWTAAPVRDGLVNFDRKSLIPPFQGFKQLDFLYFQTVVTIPADTAVKTFTVEFDSVDDGARVFLFNSKTPEGGFFDKRHDIIKASQKAKVDFSGHAAAGENRIVVAQYDLCDPGNTIRGIRVLVDGREVPLSVVPPATTTTGTPQEPPSNSHGDVHIRTPDGLVYDFQSTGEFMLTTSDDKKVIVQARQEAHPKNQIVSINTAAAILADGQKLEFYATPRFRWFLNDKEQEVPGANGGGGRGMPGGTRLEYSVNSSGAFQFLLFWGDSSFAARVDVRSGDAIDIGVRRDSPVRNYQGVLGNMDKNAQNDMTLRDGSAVTPPADIAGINKFTDSWRLAPGESLFGDAKRDANAAAVAKNPHTEVQIPKDKLDAAAKEVKAAGITTPLVARNTAHDLALTGDKSYIETGKTQDAARKALPPAERRVVAGDKANQAVVEAENKEAAAGPSLKDQVTAAAAAGHATWVGNWTWAADDNQPADHSKLIMKSETDFVYTYAGQSYNLKGRIGHAGGNPGAPLTVNLDLPNGDHLRFEWKSQEELLGQFWKKGTKAGTTRNNDPLTTARFMRIKS